MTLEPRFDIIGAALADVTRARILCELMDGRAFTNKELACAAGVTAQTASAHLKQLGAAGLTTSLRSGRCIYHRIASAEVAGVLEALATLSPRDHLTRAKTRTLPEADTMRARSCYNHIAGRLGVLIAERLIARGVLTHEGDGISLAEGGRGWLRGLGIEAPDGRGAVVKLCLDWTERKHHIAGPLATAIMEKALTAGWLERRMGSRALGVTVLGYEVFEREFGVPRGEIEAAPEGHR